MRLGLIAGGRRFTPGIYDNSITRYSASPDRAYRTHAAPRPGLTFMNAQYSRNSAQFAGDGFLAGGGEMGALMRAHDWARTPLGPPHAWPAPLRMALRLLLNTGHPMYIWWGPELLCFYNDAYRCSIGNDRHPSSLGRPGREVWTEIWPVIGPQIEQVMSGGGATWNQNHLVPILRDGRIEPAYWTYSYSPIDDGTAPSGVGGVLVICTETTELMLAQNTLRAAESRWRALFDQAPGFMCVLSGPEHRFDYCNPRYLELVGRADILGKTVLEALPEVERQGFIALLDGVYRSATAHTASAAPIYLPSSDDSGQLQLRHLDFVYQPILDGKGEVTGILVEGSDVTDRMLATQALIQSEARFREADRRKDEFLATLAHELRNPLAPLRNAAKVLRAPATDAKTREWATTIIDRQVQTMAGLLEDLLDVSKITRGQLTLHKQLTSIASIIETSVEVARPLIDARRHTLLVALPDEPVEVEVDPLRLSQVFSNLLTNAAKYMEPNGRIEISAECHEDDVCIAVKDHGIGLEPDSLGRVFEMFAQVKGTLDRAEGGLGIGLALVKGLVGLHGGRVTAASEGLGKGSEFRVWLPSPARRAQQATDVNPQRSLLPSLSRRILVVDDNVDAAQSLAFLLQADGHEVRVAHDGEQAFIAASDFRPDIAMLDIGLPKLDGYAVAAAIRRELWGEAILLLALTGWGQNDDKRRALEAGFDFHLTKPVDLDQVSTLIAHNQPR
jgi:signal transduction histidine kinase